jgi:single-strand DNA-binding protein
MNNVTIIGRITKDLELRTTNNEKSVCEFTLAVNRKGSEGTDFITCVVWNKPAENLVKYQGKGSLIAVSGSLRVEKYQDKEDKTRYRTYVLVNSIEYLNTNKQDATPVQETKVQEQQRILNEVVDPFEEYANEVQLDESDLPF